MGLSIVIRAAALLAMVISLSATVNAISPVGISWTDTPHKDAEPAATKPAATSRPAAVAGAARFAELNRIDLFDLRRQMDAGLPLTLLDARPAYEFAQGHLPGAVSLPWGQVEASYPAVDMRLPRHAAEGRIVVYCSGTDCDMARDLGRFLQARGFDNVLLFDGGMTLWRQHQLPTEAGAR